MSNEVSNGDIFSVLMDIKESIGRLDGKVDSHSGQLAAHIADDKVLSESIQKLQISQARQRGFVAALSTMGAVVGAGLGAAVDYFSRGGHH